MMTPVFHIRLLGPLQIEKEGETLPGLRTQKTSALLAYLIQQEQPVARSYLANLLWGENTEERGRRNLSNELSYLSSHLPGIIEADRQFVQFQPSDEYWIDTARFEVLVKPPSNSPQRGEDSFMPPLGGIERGHADNLAQAINLYRGDFLAGLALDDCPEFETWLLSEQQYWQQRLAEVLDQVINYHLQRGDTSQVQTYARRWLALEPWREEAHRYLMTLLAQNGQRSAALAQFETCRRLLAEELDVEPSPETMALVEQIRTGEISTGAGVQGGWGVSSGLPVQETGVDSSPIPRSAAPQPVSFDRRNQLILWDKVKNFWIRGVLEQSLQDTTPLDVVRRFNPKAVEQPWAEVLEPLHVNPDPIPPETTMLDIFQQCDRALLLLGAPGLGKTLTLIELARQLGALAQADPGQPIPVIFNLSSWSKQRESLAQWIVRELIAKYQIPRKMGEAWLENNQLILLLDGFDEIALKFHAEGVRAINQFRETHGLTGLVVCSRAEDYTALPHKLSLGGAIQLQPLSLAQIDTYLAEAGSQLEFLRNALQSEAEYGGDELRGMLESPLMLNIFTRAYQAADGERARSDSKVVLSANQDKATRRHHLFGAYVRRMLQRRGKTEAFAAQQTEQWLTWLAQKMFTHNQTVFLIEQLQPGWLSGQRQRWLYLLGYRTIEALGIGLLIWALLLFWQQFKNQIVAKGPGLLIDALPFSTEINTFVTALLAALLFSWLFTLTDGLYFSWLWRASQEPPPIVFLSRHALVPALAGLIPAAIVLTASPNAIFEAGYWMLMSATGFGVLSYLVHGRSFQDALQPVEGLRWSWPGAFKWVIIGLVAGAGLQWIVTQMDAAFWGTGLIWVVSFFLIGGLQGRGVEVTSRPNQGVFLAFRNSLVVGVAGGISVGLVMWFIASASLGLIFGVAAALLWGLFYGGSNVLKHALIRIMLWLDGTMPWHYAEFLDYAAERILLRKVGGGYIFMHGLLQAYFVNLAPVSSSQSPIHKITGKTMGGEQQDSVPVI